MNGALAVRGAPGLGALRYLGRLFVLVAAACSTGITATKPTSSVPTRSDAAIVPPALLQFETVRAMLEDSKGNYWFGSWNQGVCRFDGRSLVYFTTADGLSDNQIRSIREDRDGVLWFEGGVGLSGFDGTKVIAPTRRDYTAPDAWQAMAGDLWFKEDGAAGATEQEARPGVYRYDGVTFRYLAYPVPADRANVTAYATTGFAAGNGGRLWFATYNAVFGYDGKAFTVLDDTNLGFGAHAGRLHVRCVLEDTQGNLWIGNNGIGVIRYDGHTATQFTQQHGLGKVGPHGARTTPLPGDVTDGSPTLHRVFSIGEDAAGAIWFGTVDHGAWRYDGQALRNYTVADGLTSKDIMCVYTDRRGDLWLAGNGVFKFNGESFDRVF